MKLDVYLIGSCLFYFNLTTYQSVFYKKHIVSAAPFNFKNFILFLVISPPD